MKNFVSLKRLYLGGDTRSGGKRITDASIDTLAALTNLEWLELQNTNITEQSAKRLCELPRLKTLWLSSSALTEQTREEMKKQRPNLKVYFGS